VGTLTELSDPATARGPRTAVHRGPRTAPRQAGLDALHTEIDNPLDLIAGRQLLTEAGGRRIESASPADRFPGGRTDRPLPGELDRLVGTGTRIFLIERHPVASAGLRTVLGAEPGLRVVGSSAEPLRALDAVRRTRPDVVLLGSGGSLGNDLAAVLRLRGPEGHPDARVLLLRRVESTAEASRVMLAGASGCFPLDLAEDRIIGAVRLAAADGSVFLPAPPTARCQPANPPGHPAELLPADCGLTGREHEVLAQLARGLTNAEIGRELALAEATVKKHLTQAMRKIGQSDRLRAALYAHRHGLAG
jgi:DNA-binding NarL/FixJ family response regulator